MRSSPFTTKPRDLAIRQALQALEDAETEIAFIRTHHQRLRKGTIMLELTGYDTTVTKTWRDGEKTEYRAKVAGWDDAGAGTLFIAVTREPRDEKYGGPELSLMDENGELVGIRADVYGPEVDEWAVYSEDRNPDKPKTKPATVNWCATGNQPPAITRASAILLDEAGALAARWTREAQPKLEAEAEEIRQKREAHKAEAEREKQHGKDLADSLLRFVDTQMRITLPERFKNPRSGVLTRYVTTQTTDSYAGQKFMVGNTEFHPAEATVIEWKDPSSKRFVPADLDLPEEVA